MNVLFLSLEILHDFPTKKCDIKYTSRDGKREHKKMELMQTPSAKWCVNGRGKRTQKNVNEQSWR